MLNIQVAVRSILGLALWMEMTSETSIKKYGSQAAESAFKCSQGLPRLEVLAGGGWDNLRNVDMGRILLSDYSKCKTSEDGKYIIPDNTFVIPMKTSEVSTFASLYDNWSNFSSATASSINVEAKGFLFFGSISGSFSQMHQFIKKHQVQDKAFITRVQLRYALYKVKVQPDSQLHPTFKNRLLQIASHIQGNNKDLAIYLADLLVRDFGSHIVTSIDAGAALEHVESVKTSFRNDHKGHDIGIKEAASLSFYRSFLKADQSYTKFASKKFIDQYLGNRTSSKTKAYGGLPYTCYKTNCSVKGWVSSLGNNLVAIDRSGEPLHYTVMSSVLPELPEPTLSELVKHVESAIKRYYDHNKYSGCTDLLSDNFNFQANDDDGSCHERHTNFTFGGVFQTCTVTGSPSKNPCKGYPEKNSKTADFSCPKSYKAVKVHQGRTYSDCHRKCSGTWFWKKCTSHCGHGIYKTYWCVAEKTIPEHSGFLFGGIYSPTMANPLTQSHGCPSKFFPLRFGAKMHVCLSDDYEWGSQYSVPFGGFFSCNTGNPLALITCGSSSLDSLNVTSRNNGTTLKQFLFSQGPSNWPKHCPTGYSQHLAAIEADCEILYCIKAKALTAVELPAIRRPPFSESPGAVLNMTYPLVIANMETNKIYLQDSTTKSWRLATKR